MPNKEKTKFDRCVEGVSANSPEVTSPEAVCVSQGIKPSTWKKSMPTEMIKFDSNGQWSLEKQEKIKVAPENSKNRKTYLKEFKKSEIEILFYNDNSIDIEYDEDISSDVLNKAVSDIESLGYEELEKKEWSPKTKHKSKSGGLTQAGVESYRRANPGSKLKTAVTESKPKGKRAKRRKSFCARNKGQIDMHNIDCRKTPEKRACLARKKWRCKN